MGYKLSKEVQRDAHELARAEMFYGEGAGTRRKLIKASVQDKISRDPSYAWDLEIALQGEDMAWHAQEARKERRRLDRNQTVQKNVRALKTGNHQNLSTGLFVVVGLGIVAHQTGLDKKVYEAGKAKYYKIKHRFQAKRATVTLLKNN